MKKFLIIISCFSILYLSSQIKMNVTAQNNRCLLDNCDLKVTIINDSKTNYIIPIDTTGLKAFDENLFWLDFAKSDKVEKNLCLELSISDLKRKSPLKAITRTESIDLDSNNLDSLLYVYKKNNEEYQKKVGTWKTTNNIRNNKTAENNMYLNQSILLLDAGEKISFIIKFDTSFNLSKSSMYSYYLVSPATKYNFNLRLNVPSNIQSYFTLEQISNFKNYKVFNGQISSNTMSFIFEKDKYTFSN